MSVNFKKIEKLKAKIKDLEALQKVKKKLNKLYPF